MSEHRATVEWKRSGEFRYGTSSRSHILKFGEIAVPGSAAPANIPVSALGGPGVDPEQAFVASLSACQKKWVVESYVDEAVGVLDKTWVSRVTLRPTEEHAALHERAHEKCFIANSVKTEVMVEPCLK